MPQHSTQKKMKTSFIIHTSFYEPIRSLSDKQLGRIFRALFDYQLGNDVQVEDDIKMAFLFFKNQMDIDEQRYNNKVETNKHNGSKGGAPKGNNNARKKTTENNRNNRTVEKTTETTLNDNVNVNENDNENGGIYACAREEPPPVDFRHTFDIFVAEWNALANDPAAKVRASPVNWLDPPDAVIRPYLDRCREYGVDVVHGAIGKLRNAVFWHGKKVGIGTILEERMFLKLISGEYDNVFTKAENTTKPPNHSDENERVLRKQDEEYERLLASRAIGDIEKHPSNA